MITSSNLDFAFRTLIITLALQCVLDGDSQSLYFIHHACQQHFFLYCILSRQSTCQSKVRIYSPLFFVPCPDSSISLFTIISAQLTVNLKLKVEIDSNSTRALPRIHEAVKAPMNAATDNASRDTGLSHFVELSRFVLLEHLISICDLTVSARARRGKFIPTKYPDTYIFTRAAKNQSHPSRRQELKLPFLKTIFLVLLLVFCYAVFQFVLVCASFYIVSRLL